MHRRSLTRWLRRKSSCFVLSMPMNGFAMIFSNGGTCPTGKPQKGIEAADHDLQSAKKQEFVPLPSSLFPTVSKILFRFSRTERQLAAIQCIEALAIVRRRPSWRTAGDLDDIKEVPIPLNPVTGKPFPYRLEGKTAVVGRRRRLDERIQAAVPYSCGQSVGAASRRFLPMHRPGVIQTRGGTPRLLPREYLHRQMTTYYAKGSPQTDLTL